MKKLATGLLAGTAALALSATALPSAVAVPSHDAPTARDAARAKPDNRPGPLTKKQDRLRAKALAMLDNGSAKLRQRTEGATVNLDPGAASPQFYEFPTDKNDKIWTVLSEFSDVKHDQIPKPDRTLDNSTYWESDFEVPHYEELFNGSGESMKSYYEDLSSGRYSVTNTVEDWVTVPGGLATYGANDVEDVGGSWSFIADTVNAWYAAQIKSGKTAEQVDAYLASLDTWDRYDFNGNGNFNEPDGYIDHFQAVHAGEGEEAGASADAIWSHRWYVNGDDFGTTGPTVGGSQNKLGGARIGTSRLWIGDYTVEPENGGLGVFAHEFGHDLGLPDYYDTNGGDNGTSFWTLMSSGSWLGHGPADQAIGTTPGLMGAEEKLELGWLDYTEVDPGEAYTANLGPSQHTYDDTSTEANESDQAVKVNLPDKKTVTPYTTPPEGTNAWWSGRGDNLNNTLTRSVPSAGKVTVTTAAWYDIEADYDFLYAEYSTDGTNWTKVGTPVDGTSKGKWTKLRYTYNAGGVPSQFRFRYQTDGGLNLAGAFLDEITVGTVTDGAENGDNGWTAKGWKVSTGTETVMSSRYYLLENRQYVGYDQTLDEGPYNFSNGITKPNWVEFFQYRPGLLVWLVDDGFADNNTSTHPGGGAALPVDAFAAPFTYPDGTFPGNRRQPFDATFGIDANPETCLHKEVLVGKGSKQAVQSVAACAPARAQQPAFDDTDALRYWSAANPQNSVKVAGVGVTATVKANNSGFLTVDVVNPATPVG
ncbi:immune inhibitor A domain-containing protein [Nocardioides zhouii]|uniref:M6 family metalloprotease domain-containing protein n=1 Tax=Nocardioides zhouii TaxID=1168729 RepID=A0A4Q2SQ07_9ACTN|nr:immune inhibitor A domain-containing protein [Nocardioides zhouii]RYC07221.1 M6 family metalloprotease domain-containing protein [Nocardioides zhouii]